MQGLLKYLYRVSTYFASNMH